MHKRVKFKLTLDIILYSVPSLPIKEIHGHTRIALDPPPGSQKKAKQRRIDPDQCLVDVLQRTTATFKQEKAMPGLDITHPSRSTTFHHR
jgi:hypothetical protein